MFKKLKNPPAYAGDARDASPIPGSQEDPLEEDMATHSSILAWRIPGTEEPGGLQSVGPQRVGHNWVTEQQSRAVQITFMNSTSSIRIVNHQKKMISFKTQSNSIGQGKLSLAVIVILKGAGASFTITYGQATLDFLAAFLSLCVSHPPPGDVGC